MVAGAAAGGSLLTPVRGVATAVLPHYPVYVISKGRAATCLTARFLDRDGVPFRLVVEPQEADEYGRRFGADRIIELPFRDLGLGSIPARNFVKDHATESGVERHWILDDNIGQVRRLYRGRRIPCASGPAFAAVEDFTDRYENVAISGLAYQMFGIRGALPVVVNAHVYSCLLILNRIPHLWRGRYNEDTDLCLQVLADGWCTALVNVFLIDKKATMTMAGGNSDDLYAGDGRLRMARSLERSWPGVVSVNRRYGRPQHVVDWKKFDTPLILKPGVDLAALPANEYGLRLRAVRPVENVRLREAIGGEATSE